MINLLNRSTSGCSGACVCYHRFCFWVAQRGILEADKKVTKMEALQRLLSNDMVDSDVKNVLQPLMTENKQKDMKIANLEGQMRQMEIKINTIERYQSKDCLIFRNLPVGSYGSIINDTVEFINQVMKVTIEPADLKACHPLGPINFKGQTTVIAKFIYFDQKDRIYSRKKFLKFYCHPTNKKPVYISEHLTKFDMQLKEAAEAKSIFVSTKNSAPIIHVEQEGVRTQHVINSLEDVMELKNMAFKRKKPVMSTHTKLPMSDATNLKTPMPTLERAQVVIPATPLTTRVPTMKRGRVLTPTQDSDIKEFLEEIKARQSNKEELLDYVLG